MPPRTRAKTPAKKPAAKRTTRRAKSTPPPDNPYLAGNALVCGDNLDILRELPDECVDLIYLDPPFNSNHNYVAAFGDKGGVDAQLRDIWRWTVESENQYQRLPEGPLRNAVNAVKLVSGDTSPMAAYALFMGRRLAELWRVLKPTGSLYLHCDDTAGHHLRILSDALFGNDRYQNEIVWQRQTSNNAVTGRFGRIADYILFYTKTDKATWNQVRGELSAAELREYRQDSEGRYYKTDNLTAPGGRPERQFTWRGATPSESRSWAYDKKTLEAMLAEGRIELGKSGKAKLRGRITYLDDNPGQKLQSIWTDVPRVGNTAKERVGYPTQKPLALLERIITASSSPAGLVLDPFCGCGTAADAAAKLGRGYLGIDVSAIAVRVMEQRLASRGGVATPSVYRMGWEDYEWETFERRALMHESDAEDGLPGWAWAEDKVAGLLNAVPNLKKVGDGGVDARYFTATGAVVPIQVKMYQGQIGRPQLQNLLGVQTEWQNRKINAPMSLMVTLYPPRETLRVYAAQQGRVSVKGVEYPKMQVLSVQEMLTKDVRPKLPPVDPRYFVGDTQTRLAIS